MTDGPEYLQRMYKFLKVMNESVHYVSKPIRSIKPAYSVFESTAEGRIPPASDMAAAAAAVSSSQQNELTELVTNQNNEDDLRKNMILVEEDPVVLFHIRCALEEITQIMRDQLFPQAKNSKYEKTLKLIV